MTVEQETPLVTITEAAARAFGKILAQKGVEDAGMKVSVGPGGCGGFQYNLGVARKPGVSDIVSESRGVRLFLDSKTLHMFRGGIVDFGEGLMGAGFSVSNPMARASCACGQSFKVAGEGAIDSGACASKVAGRG